ncbi:syntaxin-112-like [Chenopodium quinoa]|uniref:t-SNARE coiled-coil homology domain-containing protein n=1 Tax=Chenopodium quinoa TaxID=63459 RepID=A0A803KYG0_CHEQI|nr:syntaxin-112-like [Chenopodium quinoa]
MNDLMTKSFLSYVDLKKQIQTDLETELSDAETWKELNPIDQENLSVFFKEIDLIKSQMEEISNLLHELESLHQESKTTHSTKLLRGFRDRMDSDTIAILRKVKSLKSRLESLDSSNVSNRRVSVSFREGSTVDRTRVAVTNGLRIKFKDMIFDFTGLRETIMNDHRDDLRRKYYNATGEAPSEETVEKLLSGSLKIEVFEGRVGGADKEEKERYEVVKDIQRSLNKLHQVFLDMAVLIEKQGEQINDIEQNVVNAGEYISGGTNSLYYAKQMKKKNRNWVHWVWAVGFIILLVCFISLIALR